MNLSSPSLLTAAALTMLCACTSAPRPVPPLVIEKSRPLPDYPASATAPCPPLEIPEVTQETWDALSATEQAALEDSWALSWALDYHLCAMRHNALTNHLEKLYNVEP